jgi:hypothetical protein
VTLPFLTADTAGLLAQILPVFLLVFALEGGRLVSPNASVLAKRSILRLRLYMVIVDLFAIGLCVLVYNFGDDYTNHYLGPLASAFVVASFGYSLFVLLAMVILHHRHEIAAVQE